jgi:uncharacterized protein
VAEPVWDLVRGIPACLLQEVPRRAGEHEQYDESREQRLAALVSAFHADSGGVLVGWRRVQAYGPVEVFVGGHALIADTDQNGGAVLSLPVGGRGRVLPPELVAEAMGRLPHWVRIAAIIDGLLTDTARPAGANQGLVRPSLEEGLLSVWTQPFAWLLYATPMDAGAVADLADEHADRQQRAQSMAEMSPENAVAAVRLEHRHRELRQAATSGMWTVHLLAGASTPQAAARVAGLVCASTDLDGQPYALVPQKPGRPGKADLDHNRIPVGQMSLPSESLNRHTFVCGATGAGKSQTVRALLAAATGAGLPWLVVEPAKAEYRLMAARLPDIEVVTIRPGDADAIAAGINPLEPGRDSDGRAFPLQTHADLVRALFLAAFESDEPFPQVLSAALTRCYEQLGWDLALGEPAVPGTAPRYPTLADLQAVAEQVVTEIGYGQEVTDNVRGFIKVRLSSLRLGTTGRFFEGGHPIDFDQLLKRNVVLEIEDVGDDRDKAFLMGTVLVRLVEHLRMRQRHDPAAGLQHLSVFEEAHRLLRRSDQAGPAAHAVETFAGLLAEIRAYGEGLIVAEQIPSKLVPDVIKNTAVKIVHRLPAKDDRDAVGATMNITDAQSAFLVTLTPGEGAVFTDGMDYPVLVRMPDGTAIEDTGTATMRLGTPAVLVTPRSRTCGPDCVASPCTLRDMRTAQHTLTEHPALVLWAELAVAAHLTGWGPPLPGRGLKETLNGLPTRVRDCAISHAVDAAVAARSTVIPATSSPGQLADHVTTVLRAQVHGDSICAHEEIGYYAAPYRWCLILEELQRAHSMEPDAGPHPSTGDWQTRYKRLIPGDSLAQQLQQVTAWWDREQRDRTAIAVALWGTGLPSPIETATGARRDDNAWPERLREAAAELTNTGSLLGSYSPARPADPAAEHASP